MTVGSLLGQWVNGNSLKNLVALFLVVSPFALFLVVSTFKYIILGWLLKSASQNAFHYGEATTNTEKKINMYLEQMAGWRKGEKNQLKSNNYRY